MPLPPTPAVHLAVLGQVQAASSTTGELTALTSLPANLLLALALAPGHALSTSGLVADVWGDSAPGNAKAALQTLVSRTRRRHLDGLLVSTGAGYALHLGDGHLDLDLAQSLAGRARAALSSGDVAAAEAHARQGLALWTGEPGTGATDERLVEELAARATSLDHALRQCLAEAFLGSGRPEEAARLLASLRTHAPFSDPLCLLHLTALARAGRSNDAVDEYARFRLALADALGTDPSPALARFHDSLLRHDAAAPTDRVTVGLRTAPDPLVGRSREVEELLTRLSSQRLVTVLGMGGLGKTRLAQETAARAAQTFPAVYVVELAAARTALDLATAVAATLGAENASPGGSPEDSLPQILRQVTARLAERPTLLVLDNLEQAVDAAAEVVALLLSGAPASTRVLATSRAALAISGEHLLHLAPLSAAPDGDATAPAVQLFLDRARALRPDAHLPQDVIARLCSRLDGLPLAIELAAARIRSMTVVDIDAGLGDRFALLTSGRRSAPARHRTLHDVIAWSWELLDARQQVLCRRVAGFVDGFTAQAAAFVLAPDGEGAVTVEVLDLLDAAAAQSFLRVEDDPTTGTSRLRMLETVREFCRQQAVVVGETHEVRAGMLRWARSTCAVDLAQLHGPAQEITFRRLRTERENLMDVLRQAMSAQDHDTVACVFAAVGLWQLHRGAYLDGAALSPPVQDCLVGLAPEGPRAATYLWSHLLIGSSQLVFGDLRRSARARRDVARPARAARGSAPLADTAAAVFRSLADMTEVDRLLAGACTSPDPTTALLAHLFSSVRSEDGGDIDAAFVHASAAHHAAVEAHDLWAQASASAQLAKLFRQSRQPQDALWWGARATAGRAALGIDSPGRSVPTALDRLADGQLAAAEEVFRTVLDSPDPTADQLLLASAGLAEVHLALGRTDEGLVRLREMSDQLVWTASDLITPNLLVGSTCVVAHVLNPPPGSAPVDEPWLADVVASLRALVLQVDEITPEHTDRPVLGAVAVARAAWATMSSPPAGTADLSGGAASDVVELLALAERLHSRQDLPHLAVDPVWHAVGTWLSGSPDTQSWVSTRAAARAAAQALSLGDSARRTVLLLERLG